MEKPSKKMSSPNVHASNPSSTISMNVNMNSHKTTVSRSKIPLVPNSSNH
jgi:hypothetical protein